MAAVTETVVREFFEQHDFVVRQYRKYVAPAGRDDEDPDFFVLNPTPQSPGRQLPFVLGVSDLPFIQRALVVIKGWHTEVFTPRVLTSGTADMFRFLEKKAFRAAVRGLEAQGPFLKLLAIPRLPNEGTTRQESIEVLHSKGIDAVITFEMMLADLVQHVQANRNYQKSDLLQTIRLLKSYDLIKEPQLELFKSRSNKRKSRED